MRVLVTGGTGFIGSQLAACLVARRHAVRVMHRSSSSLVGLADLPVEHCVGDILHPASVADAVKGCDLVFHVAAIASYWRARRSEVYRINVEGTRTVMRACLEARVPRVVHTSSVAAVGLRSDARPADESTPFDSLSATFAYADSKHRAEAEVQEVVAQGLDAVIVNPAIVIGAGDHYLISGSMIIEFARGRVPGVPCGGSCFVDVEAVVQGHVSAAERGRTGERYILGGENLTYRETVDTIASIVGKRPPLLTLPGWALNTVGTAVDALNRVNPRPPMVIGEQIRLSALNFYFDSTKAQRELDFPILPFRDAVIKAYRWYSEHGYM